MNNELSTAFIDSPPEGLAVWNTRTRKLIIHILSTAGVEATDVNLYGAYSLASRGVYVATPSEIVQEFVDAPNGRVEEADAYTSRVTEREQSAEVETPDNLGKP
jgi:hypothetical protein